MGKVLLLGRSQRFSVNGQISEVGRVITKVPQGSVLGPLLYLTCVNVIWRNTECNIRLFADDFKYKKNDG